MAGDFNASHLYCSMSIEQRITRQLELGPSSLLKGDTVFDNSRKKSRISRKLKINQKCLKVNYKKRNFYIFEACKLASETFSEIFNPNAKGGATLLKPMINLPSDALSVVKRYRDLRKH